MATMFIEAADLDEAIAIAGGIPTLDGGIKSVPSWSLTEASNGFGGRRGCGCRRLPDPMVFVSRRPFGSPVTSTKPRSASRTLFRRH